MTSHDQVGKIFRGDGRISLTQRWVLTLLVFGVFLEGACGRRGKEITSLQRKEAASLASEAEFAVTMRQLPRAEGLLTKVVALCPDNGDFWVSLGSVRMRLGDRNGAERAYKSALDAFEDAAKLDKKDGTPVLQQVYVLALLGRVDAARKLLEKSQKKYPDDRALRAFIQENQLDRVIADPGFKEMSL